MLALLTMVVVAGLLVLFVGICDPRWLAAAALLFMAAEAKNALPVMSGRSLLLDAILP